MKEEKFISDNYFYLLTTAIQVSVFLGILYLIRWVVLDQATNLHVLGTLYFSFIIVFCSIKLLKDIMYRLVICNSETCVIYANRFFVCFLGNLVSTIVFLFLLKSDPSYIIFSIISFIALSLNLSLWVLFQKCFMRLVNALKEHLFKSNNELDKEKLKKVLDFEKKMENKNV